MIAAVIACGAVALVLAGVLLLVLRLQAEERREWVAERRSLIDRAIAQHTGEILALDRQSQQPPREHAERPQPIGIS